jgi:hypothetical protein
MFLSDFSQEAVGDEEYRYRVSELSVSREGGGREDFRGDEGGGRRKEGNEEGGGTSTVN